MQNPKDIIFLYVISLIFPTLTVAFEGGEHRNISDRAYEQLYDDVLNQIDDCPPANAGNNKNTRIDEPDSCNLKMLCNGVAFLREAYREKNKTRLEKICKKHVLDSFEVIRHPSFGQIVEAVDYFVDPIEMITASRGLSISGRADQPFELRLNTLGSGSLQNLTKASKVNVAHFQEDAVAHLNTFHGLAAQATKKEDEWYSVVLYGAIATHYRQDLLAPGHTFTRRRGLESAPALNVHNYANDKGAKYLVHCELLDEVDSSYCANGMVSLLMKGDGFSDRCLTALRGKGDKFVKIIGDDDGCYRQKTLMKEIELTVLRSLLCEIKDINESKMDNYCRIFQKKIDAIISKSNLLNEIENTGSRYLKVGFVNHSYAHESCKENRRGSEDDGTYEPLYLLDAIGISTPYSCDLYSYDKPVFSVRNDVLFETEVNVHKYDGMLETYGGAVFVSTANELSVIDSYGIEVMWNKFTNSCVGDMVVDDCNPLGPVSVGLQMKSAPEYFLYGARAAYTFPLTDDIRLIPAYTYGRKKLDDFGSETVHGVYLRISLGNGFMNGFIQIGRISRTSEALDTRGEFVMGVSTDSFELLSSLF